MKKLLIAALLCSPMAVSAAGHFEVNLLKGDMDATVTGFGRGSVDTDGFALRGELGEPGQMGVSFEYNKISPDASNSDDLSDLRIGLVIGGKDVLFGKLELINLDSGSGSETGYGGSVGVRSVPKGAGVGGLASIGYASVDDGKGLEFNLEGSYTFDGGFGLVANYRSNNYEFDGGELTIKGLRVGGRYSF